jgi:hypothetical protein
MTDRKKAGDKDQSSVGDPSQGIQPPNKREENNEWLRDQVGEDSNLSGSSTYRTLPDQPTDGNASGDVDAESAQDTKDRQSNR